MSAFYPFRGGGPPKADIVCFFLPFFLYDGFPKFRDKIAYVGGSFLSEKALTFRGPPVLRSLNICHPDAH